MLSLWPLLEALLLLLSLARMPAVTSASWTICAATTNAQRHTPCQLQPAY
jgi:hypothetical protein